MLINKYKYLSVVLFMLVTWQIRGQENYSIKIQINGLSDTTAILARYLANTLYPVDTTTLDANGKGTFKGKEKLSKGLYVLYLPDGSNTQFIVGENRIFSITTDTSDLTGKMQFENSKENDVFYDFQHYMMQNSSRVKTLEEKLNTESNPKKKEAIYNKFKQIEEDRRQKVKNLIKANPDLFTATFLKTTLPIEVPDELKNNKTAAYNYYKKHYFDNFDLADPGLLHTPFYEEKLLGYLDNVVIQHPDSLIKELNWIMEKTLPDSNIFRYAIITLSKKYGRSDIMGMDAVQVYLMEMYYIEFAWWVNHETKADYQSKIDAIKPLLIGKSAPDVQLRYIPDQHFKEAKNDTAIKRYPHAGSFFKISDVEAEYTVLLFWQASCSHCKISVPEFHKLYTDSLQTMGVKVVAVSGLFGSDGKEQWVDFVNNRKLYGWINAWNPYSGDFTKKYNLQTYPVVFVLDKNKEIIGKKLGADNLMGFLHLHRKLEHKKAEIN